MSLTSSFTKRSFLLSHHAPAIYTRVTIAPFSTNQSSAHESTAAHLNPRWLSELKSRIGKCLLFGLKPQQNKDAGEILNGIARDWRELVAGSEGFLTGKRRRGLYRHGVVWGDMIEHISQLGRPPVANETRIDWVILGFYESARIKWAHNFANYIDPAHKNEWNELWTPHGEGLILRSIKIDYKFPMTWPDHITVYHKLRSLPSSSTNSFILDVLILSELHQRPVARCVEDIVVYDYKKVEKLPLRPFMVEEFRKTYAMQQEQRTECGKRIRDLVENVEQLEKGSWNREDSQEDFGGSCDSGRGHGSDPMGNEKD
ncbi:MAG: hypothetical protein M1835_003117 [Candelina submexicana]|nr:MAG: hypothetical protein M1835_003117 [Candelina submexicana]